MGFELQAYIPKDNNKIYERAMLHSPSEALTNGLIKVSYMNVFSLLNIQIITSEFIDSFSSMSLLVL